MIIRDGKEYARVSDILKPFYDFSMIDQTVLQNKANIGTRVHEAIAEEILGDFPVLGEKEEGYFASFCKWCKAINPIFLKSEERYFDDVKMMTGCIDAIAKLSCDSKAVLIDFKTSSQESKITWPMQAHLYSHLLRVNDIDVSPRYLFIKLDKFGNLPEVYEYKHSSNIMANCFNAIDLFWKSRKDENNPFS
jgi:thiol-disulfide isomerase/thioredoxin